MQGRTRINWNLCNEKSCEEQKRKYTVRDGIATDKRKYPHNTFLISPRKHMLWVLIRSASITKTRLFKYIENLTSIN